MLRMVGMDYAGIHQGRSKQDPAEITAYHDSASCSSQFSEDSPKLQHQRGPLQAELYFELPRIEENEQGRKRAAFDMTINTTGRGPTLIERPTPDILTINTPGLLRWWTKAAESLRLDSCGSRHGESPVTFYAASLTRTARNVASVAKSRSHWPRQRLDKRVIRNSGSAIDELTRSINSDLDGLNESSSHRK